MIKIEVSEHNHAALEELGGALKRIAARSQAPTFSGCACTPEDCEPEQIVADETPSTAAQEQPQTAEQTTAPVATEPTTAPAASSGVELDDLGLPWDSRINTDSRTTIKADGSWKLKRGIDQALVDQVRAELRAAMAAPSPADTTTEPPVAAETAGAPVGMPAAQQQPTAEPPATTGAPVGMPPTVSAQPSATEPPVAAEQPAMNFPQLVSEITKHQSDGTLTVIETQEVCKKHGLAQIALAATRPDIIPTIYNDLVSIWSQRQPVAG